MLSILNKAFYLHSCRYEEGCDHDSSTCQEIGVGVEERGQPEVGHHKVVQAAVRRLVHRRCHGAAEKKRDVINGLPNRLKMTSWNVETKIRFRISPKVRVLQVFYT